MIIMDGDTSKNQFLFNKQCHQMKRMFQYFKSLQNHKLFIGKFNNNKTLKISYLCRGKVLKTFSDKQYIYTHTHIYIYIYIHVCVCM